MNQDSSADLSTSAPASAEAISRRAYEIWEREGRPDGCDLRHWLAAEHELRTQSTGTVQSENAPSSPRNTGSDLRPLQGTRAAAAVNRETKRPPASPLGTDRNAASPPSSARKKPSNAQAM